MLVQRGPSAYARRVHAVARGRQQPGIGHSLTPCIPSFRFCVFRSVADVHGADRHIACFPEYGCLSVLRRHRANHAGPRHWCRGTWEEEGRRREADEDSVNPGASVIMVGAADAGILIVQRLPHEIQLRMLCLLPSYQGYGIGCSLVSALQKEAAARCVPLRLHVLKVNSAKHFDERLGFGVEEETEYFFHMHVM